MNVNDLTPAELRVYRAFPRGELVDFTVAEDDSFVAEWGPERTLRASVLKALLVAAPQEEGETAALSVSGARITGELNLNHTDVKHPVWLDGCYFDVVPECYGLRVPELSLSGSTLPGLRADTSRVDGDLNLSKCSIRGPLQLAAAEIAGSLVMNHARLTNSAAAVLQLNHAVIGRDLKACWLHVEGYSQLEGAQVSGRVCLDHADLDASTTSAIALEAQSLSVGSDFHASHLRVNGCVDLHSARVPGQLDLSHIDISQAGRPKRSAVVLRVSGAMIGELWLRDVKPIYGSVDLRYTQIEVLHVAPPWPDAVLLNGLTYSKLAPSNPVEHRLRMLEGDEDGYVPFAYEQLAAAYRRIGDDRSALLVQLAKHRRHRTTLPWYGRLWDYIQGATVGYGFRPLRAAGLAAALIVIALLVVAWLSTRAVLSDISSHAELGPADAPPLVAAIVSIGTVSGVLIGGILAGLAKFVRARGQNESDIIRARGQTDADLIRAQAEMKRAEADVIRARMGLPSAEPVPTDPSAAAGAGNPQNLPALSGKGDGVAGVAE